MKSIQKNASDFKGGEGHMRRNPSDLWKMGSAPATARNLRPTIVRK